MSGDKTERSAIGVITCDDIVSVRQVTLPDLCWDHADERTRNEMTPTGRRGGLSSDAVLLLVPALWGWGYPLIRGSMDAIGPLGFLWLRFLTAVVALAPVLAPRLRTMQAGTWRPALTTGVALFLAYAFLNWGLVHTTTARAGFIIGLRVVMVPAIGALVFRLGVSGRVGIAALVSVLGLGFIFLGDGGGLRIAFGPGDVFMIASAACFAVHVLLVDRYARRDDLEAFLLVQLVVVAALAGLGATMFEARLWPSEPAVWRDASLAGVFATGLAFWIQNRFQPRTTANHTGIIFSTEPVFAALFGFLYLGERLVGWQWMGAGLIIAAMLMVQGKGRPGRRRS
ncbi:EamA family transporter [bacterium]|nr:EamA family transporter [bacterium]